MRFVLEHARQHRSALLEQPLPAASERRLAELAQTSLERQRAIEASDTVPFETYRQRYLAPASLVAGNATT